MNDLLPLLLIIIIVILYISTIVWICSEADNRKDVSVIRTAIICLVLSPIAGILYLLLFPRIEEEGGEESLDTRYKRWKKKKIF